MALPEERLDRIRPAQSTEWRTFLTNHASQIMAADLFVVPTVTFRLLFVLVILANELRRIVHVAVTHPTACGYQKRGTPCDD